MCEGIAALATLSSREKPLLLLGIWVAHRASLVAVEWRAVLCPKSTLAFPSVVIPSELSRQSYLCI
jgi:hypothetical protein